MVCILALFVAPSAVYVDYKIADPTDAESTDGVTIKYAWYLRATTYEAIKADMAGLGIKDVTSNDVVVIGSTFKPPKVSKTVVVGNKKKTITTFCSSSKLDSLPAGWS